MCSFSSSGYQTLVKNLSAFSKLGKLPKDVDLKRLDEGQGIAATLCASFAKKKHSELDEKVRKFAEFLEDTTLSA